MQHGQRGCESRGRSQLDLGHPKEVSLGVQSYLLTKRLLVILSHYWGVGISLLRVMQVKGRWFDGSGGTKTQNEDASVGVKQE